MTLRVFEAFAGIGTQRMALRNLGIDHEVVAISEIDKFAIQSYEAIHGEVNNLGDISKLDDDAIPDHDLFTYSFPCQDISVAGQGKGLAEGSGTRSSLLWECERVIESKRPKYLLLENVKNLVGKKNKPHFEKWLEILENYGYTNYWQVLNAKDYGIPQNRERVFVVSVLGEHRPYIFPNKEELVLRLKDVLEDEVDEKYYLNDEKAKQLIATITGENNITESTVVDASVNDPKVKNVMNTITARYDAGIQNYKSIGGAVIEPERILGIFDKENSTHQSGSVYNKEKIAPTLDTMQGGWRQPSIIEPKIAASRGRGENNEQQLEGIPIKNATNKGYLMAKDGDGVDLAYPTSSTRRGRVQESMSQTLTTDDSKGVVEAKIALVQPKDRKYKEKGLLREEHLEFSKDNTSPSLRASNQAERVLEPSFRIRKLTPLECWRLMGCSDGDFKKAESVCSNSQLYKQAGNAIVVDVLEAIFKKLFLKEDVGLKDTSTDFQMDITMFL